MSIPLTCHVMCVCCLTASHSLTELPLMSLWIFFSECRYSRPLRISRRMVAIWVSSSAPGSIFERKSSIRAEGVDGLFIWQEVMYKQL